MSPVVTSLRPTASGDVAGADFLDLVALVGVHLHHAADAFRACPSPGSRRVAGFEHARVDAEEGQRADERVGRDLERKRSERRLVIGLARSVSSLVHEMPSMAFTFGAGR